MAVPYQFLQGTGRQKYEPPVDPPYIFQAYPAMRYHPDGRTKVVNSDGEADALGAEWQASPCDAPAQAEAADCASCTSLTIELADQKARFNNAWAARVKEFDDLKASHDQLQGAFTDLQVKYAQLQKGRGAKAPETVTA